MKTIWSKHRLLIIIFGFLILLVSAVYFLAVPLVKKIKTVSNEMQGKLIDREVEQSRLESLSRLEEDWRVFETEKDSFEVILSPESELGFIEGVEAIAEKTGNIITLNIGENADPREISKIKRANKKGEGEKGILDEIGYTNFFPIQINLRGDYNGLVNFMHMLENNHFYVNIISLDIKKEMVGKDEPQKAIFSEKDKEQVAEKEILSTNINAIVYTKKQ